MRTIRTGALMVGATALIFALELVAIAIVRSVP